MTAVDSLHSYSAVVVAADWVRSVVVAAVDRSSAVAAVVESVESVVRRRPAEVPAATERTQRRGDGRPDESTHSY